MHSRNALIAALVAATPSLALVQPRQASEDFSATLAALSTCEAALSSAYSGVPTLPADILSWVESEATAIEAAGACAFPSPPASLSADLNSYTAAVESWWTAHSAEVSSALSLCPAASGGGAVTSTPCTAFTAAGGGGANTPTATAPPTSTGTGTTGQGTTTAGAPGSGTTGAGGSSGTTGAGAGGSSTTATKNLSPKETGRIVGALAAAGLIGVAAMIL